MTALEIKDIRDVARILRSGLNYITRQPEGVPYVITPEVARACSTRLEEIANSAELGTDLSSINQALKDIKAALSGKNKDSYTVSEASEVTGLSRETIWRLCRDFHLAFTQRTAKSKIMINGDSLRRYMAENPTQKEAYKLPVNLRTKAGRKVRRMMVGAHPEE